VTPTGRRQGLRLMGVTLLSLLGVGSAQAQGPSIWRCGADGRQFSDRPCSDGQLLAGPAPLSAEAQHAAQQVAQREQALADALARERLQRHRVLPGEGLQGIRSTQGPGTAEPSRSALKRAAGHRPPKARQSRLPAPRTEGPSRLRPGGRSEDASAARRIMPPGAAPAAVPAARPAPQAVTGRQRQG
jgi:hypothetical protein